METINERLSKVRSEMGLSMANFGKALLLSDAAINQLEKGKRKVTDRTIRALEQEFNVNEHWLRTGEGEMFEELQPHEELGAELKKLMHEEGEYTEFKEKLLTKMLKLPDEHWAVLRDLVLEFVDEELDKIKKAED